MYRIVKKIKIFFTFPLSTELSTLITLAVDPNEFEIVKNIDEADIIIFNDFNHIAGAISFHTLYLYHELTAEGILMATDDKIIQPIKEITTESLRKALAIFKS